MNKDKTKIFGKVDGIILGIILVLALALRLYNINTPLADYHSWRQVDTAAVARNYVKDGINLIKPVYDDLSPIQSGFDNPQGLRFVEFPIYNALMAGAYMALPFMSLEAWGRLISSLFALITIAILYYLSYKESSRVTAIGAALVFAIYPYCVFFTRVVLPESMALGCMFLSIFFLYQFNRMQTLKGQIATYIPSVIFFCMAVLIKPTAIFYGLVLAFLFIRKYKMKVFTAWPAYVFFVVAMAPFAWWRAYISQFPEGIPASGWLFAHVNTFEGRKNVFFKPAFFRWIFFERINNQILGGYTTFLFVLGAVAKPKNWLLPVIVISGFIYLFVFQGGNVQHEYYQVILFPAIAILVGLGLNYIFSQQKTLLPLPIVIPILIACTGLSIFFSYYKVKDYYGIPGDLVQIGNIVKTITPPDAKIITDRDGDTTLLYLMDRKGAPAMYKDVDILQGEGYDYLVVLNGTTIEKMKTLYKFETVFENDKFALFRL